MQEIKEIINRVLENNYPIEDVKKVDVRILISEIRKLGTTFPNGVYLYNKRTQKWLNNLMSTNGDIFYYAIIQTYPNEFEGFVNRHGPTLVSLLLDILPINYTENERSWLNHVWVMQFNGNTWGECVVSADKYYKA